MSNQITSASINSYALRLYNEETGLEVIVARAHIIAMSFDGRALSVATSLQSHVPLASWAPVHPRDVEPDCWKDLDDVVSAFVRGGVS